MQVYRLSTSHLTSLVLPLQASKLNLQPKHDLWQFYVPDAVCPAKPCMRFWHPAAASTLGKHILENRQKFGYSLGLKCRCKLPFHQTSTVQGNWYSESADEHNDVPKYIVYSELSLHCVTWSWHLIATIYGCASMQNGHFPEIPNFHSLHVIYPGLGLLPYLHIVCRMVKWWFLIWNATNS